MTRIRFNAPAGHLLVVDAKTTIEGGKEGNVAEEVAAMLVACDYADVSVVDGTHTEPSWPGTHDALDKLAARLEVIWPLPPDGKAKLNVADKIAALEAAGHTPESVLEAPVADDGATPEEKENE